MQGVYDEIVLKDADLTSTTPVEFPAVLSPIDVYRWGLIFTTAKDATAFSCQINLHETPGAAETTPEVMGLYSNAAAVAQGTTVYFEAGDSEFNAGGDPVDGPLQLDAGQQLAFECADAAVAGVADVFIQYRRRPFTGARGPDLTLVTKGTLA